VHIGADVYIGPNAVIRADEVDDSGEVKPVEIASECNVQDGVIIHALGGTKVTIGQRTSLAHGCVVHGPCTIGRGCFVGFKAVVYNAILGNGVFVSTGAVVQGVELRPNTLVPPCGTVISDEDAAGVLREPGQAECEFMERVANTNVDLARSYNRLFAHEFWR
jgi:carbonic anhydrase/acetyltransferase-like protein (isoleucine patch superfamily)